MKCIDCGANMIGNIPDDLRGTGRCRKCHNSYVESGSVVIHKVEDDVVDLPKKEEVPQDKIENRWDILDI